MKKTLQRWLVSLTLAALLVGTVAPAAAFAQDDAPPAEKYTLISASCRDGACAVVLDQDGQALTVAPIPGFPLTWPMESPETAAASVELSDKLVLNLPFGQFQILEGDFLLLLDENNRLERLNGSAQTVIPTFAMSDQVRIRGPFSASFGYDYGSALTEIDAPLLPDSQYAFLRLGAGMDIDLGGQIAAATQGITVTIPSGNNFTLVIDPVEPLVYLDGEFIVRTGLPVDLVADMANVQLPDLPILGDLTLPLRSPVGVSTLVSARPEANFLEVRGGLEVDGGIAQRVLNFEGKPLELTGVARIDNDGVHFSTGANSSLLAATPLADGAQAAVTVTNPLAEAPAWWDESLTWMDEAGAGMADAIKSGWAATGETAGSAVGSAAGAVVTGAQAAAEGAGAAAGAVAGGAQAAAEGAGAAAAAVAAGAQGVTAPLVQGAADAAGAALENSAAAAARAAAVAEQALCAWTPFCGDE
jgi:hypothetical protein